MPERVTVVEPVNIAAMSVDEFAAHLRTQEITIGGSSVGAVLGVNRYKTIASVWDDLMQFARYPSQLLRVRERVNARTQARFDRGHALEPLIAAIYGEQTGRRLIGDGETVLRSPMLPMVHARPDRLILPENVAPHVGRGVLEIKALGVQTFGETQRNGIDPSYYAQIQQYMDVLHCTWGAFAVFSPEHWELYHFDVDIDQEHLAMAHGEVNRFWHEHVLARVRPSDGVVRPAFPIRPHVGAEAVIHDEPEWRDLLGRLRQADTNRKLADTHYEQIKDQVRIIMEDAGYEKVRVAGIGMVSHTTTDRRTLDREALQREFPDVDFDRFMRTTVSRTFRFREG